MRIRTKLSLCAALFLTATVALAQSGIGPITHSVPYARQRTGNPATVIAAGFSLKGVVDGPFPLENPSGVITNFGLLSTGTTTVFATVAFAALSMDHGISCSGRGGEPRA
jgi:hypothetical protein